MSTLKELRVKNKIFYVITSLDYGGTQRQLYFLIKKLRQNLNFDYSIFLISLKSKGRFKSKFEELNIPIYYLGLTENNLILNFFILPFALTKFIILFLKCRPKIVHSFLFQANVFARILKILDRKIFLICSERVAERQKRWQKILLKFSNFLVDKFIVNSEDLKKFVSFSQKIKAEKIEVIHNLILPEEIKLKNSAEQIRASLGIRNGDFLVLSIGRLHKQKGFDLLLEIVKKFVDEVKIKNYKRRFVFVVIGDGEEMDFLLNRTRFLSLGEYIRFLGYKENVYDYINACDLFLLTSYWEGSPNVVLEAIYFKKPVISTSVEGVQDYLNEAYIVSLKNNRERIIIEFVDKILEFYLSLNECATIFKKCLKENFDINFYISEQQIVNKYLSIYN